MAAKLLKFFPGAVTGNPVIEAQVGNQPGILVKGTISQIKDVQDTINIIEGTTQAPPGATPSNRRVIGIPDGSTLILAEKLAQSLAELRSNPVQVVGPDGFPIPIKPTLAPPIPYTPPGVGPTPPNTPMPLPPGKQGLAPSRDDVRYINAQISDPNQPRFEKKPVKIEVRGKQLIITSDDPEALDLLTNLARYYTSSKPEENLFKVIRLKNVAAEDAAKTITEIFNGPQQSQQQRRWWVLVADPSHCLATSWVVVVPHQFRLASTQAGYALSRRRAATRSS